MACGRSSWSRPSDSGGFTIANTSNSASVTINVEQSLKFSLKVRVLPAISLLTKFYGLSIRSAGILNGRYHDFCVSGMNIGSISSLSALLQLACEYRNRDSYQHGRPTTTGMDAVIALSVICGLPPFRKRYPLPRAIEKKPRKANLLTLGTNSLIQILTRRLLPSRKDTVNSVAEHTVISSNIMRVSSGTSVSSGPSAVMAIISRALYR